MTANDIEAHIRGIYGLDVSDTTMSKITDKILPIAKDWQKRLLKVFMPWMRFITTSGKREDYQKGCVHRAIGTDLEGKKDVPGMWIGENESAKFWLSVMNEINNGCGSN